MLKTSFEKEKRKDANTGLTHLNLMANEILFKIADYLGYADLQRLDQVLHSTSTVCQDPRVVKQALTQDLKNTICEAGKYSYGVIVASESDSSNTFAVSEESRLRELFKKFINEKEYSLPVLIQLYKGMSNQKANFDFFIAPGFYSSAKNWQKHQTVSYVAKLYGQCPILANVLLDFMTFLPKFNLNSRNSLNQNALHSTLIDYMNSQDQNSYDALMFLTQNGLSSDTLNDGQFQALQLLKSKHNEIQSQSKSKTL